MDGSRKHHIELGKPDPERQILYVLTHKSTRASSRPGTKATEKPCLEKPIYRAGEMAQWLRALPALPKVLSSIPGNHMVAHNHL